MSYAITTTSTYLSSMAYNNTNVYSVGLLHPRPLCLHLRASSSGAGHQG